MSDSDREILIDSESYNYLRNMRVRFGTYKNCIKELVSENIRLRSEVKRLESEIKTIREKKDSVLESTLNKAMNRPINIVLGQSQMQNIVPMQSPLPPPPKFTNLSVESFDQPKLSDKAKDFVKEIASHCKGNDFLKPSDVCSVKFNEPKYLTAGDER